MRKLAAILLAIVLAVVTLAACQGDVCNGHGGVKNVYKAGSVYVYECYDGTTV